MQGQGGLDVSQCNNLNRLGAYHNIYVRINKERKYGSGKRQYYSLFLGAKGMKPVRLCQGSKKYAVHLRSLCIIKDMLALGHIIVNSSNLNFFDYTNKSDKHRILHFNPQSIIN